MKTPSMLLATLFSLVLAAWAVPADASCYANFSGNCNQPSPGGTAFCNFDGTRTYNNGHTSDLTPTSCGNSTVGMVFWDFDDPGSSTGSTWDDLVVGHTYLNPPAIDNDALIRMTLYCNDGCVAEKTRYLLFVIIGPGDMYCNQGWN
jgi:hypothetical protein